MINQMLIYSVSISMLVIILIFINRVIYYSERVDSTSSPSTTRYKPTAKFINNNVHPEKKYYWSNNELNKF